MVALNIDVIIYSRDPAILDGLDLTEEERKVLIDNINRRLTPQAVKIRAGTPKHYRLKILLSSEIIWGTCSLEI